MANHPYRGLWMLPAEVEALADLRAMLQAAGMPSRGATRVVVREAVQSRTSVMRRLLRSRGIDPVAVVAADRARRAKGAAKAKMPDLGAATSFGSDSVGVGRK